MKTIIMASTGAALALAGCSTGSSGVSATYVPTSKYSGWTCESLNVELSRVQNRAAAISGKLDKDKSTDQAVAAAGILLFWPALFFLDGNDPVKQNQLSKMLGEAEAIDAARSTACSR